jgi:hypothetical protein
MKANICSCSSDDPLVNVATAAEDDIARALLETGAALSSFYNTVANVSVRIDEKF